MGGLYRIDSEKFDDFELAERLLRRLIHPSGLALAQAAVESGWGHRDLPTGKRFFWPMGMD
ncbi:MAG: hypothetical protein CM15mP46_6980 [Alphaproteobacteria bacterium]|nr:MAG: hypothetical protein CM15mP46_6980 [Alphaproteobacteria bacterium]